MRYRPLFLCLLMVGFAAPSADADVLKLRNGGQLKGHLLDVTFAVAGKETVYTAGGIAALSVPEASVDTITLKDGRKLQGELISLRFRCYGATMKFLRRRITAIELAPDPLAPAREEYARRKAQLPEGDAGAMIALAEWCRGKGLKTESVELARAVLKSSPAGDAAEKAHKLLGHVLYEGRWRTPAEVLELKKQASAAESIENPAAPPATAAKPDPEKLKSLRAAYALNKKLYDAYLAKAKEGKKSDLAALKAQYQQELDQVADQVKKAREALDEAKDKRDKAARDFNSKYGRSATIKSYRDQYLRTYNNVVDDAQKKYAEAKRARLKVLRRAKADVKKISRKWAKIRRNLKTLYDKIQTRLDGGVLVTEEQMTAAYEERLGGED